MRTVIWAITAVLFLYLATHSFGQTSIALPQYKYPTLPNSFMVGDGSTNLTQEINELVSSYNQATNELQTSIRNDAWSAFIFNVISAIVALLGLFTEWGQLLKERNERKQNVV